MSRTHGTNKVSPLQFLAGLAVLGVLALVGYLRTPQSLGISGPGTSPAPSATSSPRSSVDSGAESIERAIAAKAEEVWVRVEAVVHKELPDDTEGDEHQRFLITLDSGVTVLVAHNTDVAPRVPVKVGTRVKIRGKYVWNDKGGLIHWTHHNERKPDDEFGWIQVGAERFE